MPFNKELGYNALHMTKLFSAQNAQILKTLVITDIRERYLNSVMGVFWTLISPMILMTVYATVISVLGGIQRGNFFQYSLFLFCGFVPWNAFNGGLCRSTTSLRDKAHMIRKVPFANELLPMALTLSYMVDMVLGLGVVIVVSIFTLGWHSTLFMLPVLFLFQFLWTLGLGFFFSVVHVYFSDMGLLLQLVMGIWLFLTPTFYPPDIVPADWSWLLAINPMHHFLHAYRETILSGHLPSLKSMLGFMVPSVIVFAVGVTVFKKNLKHVLDLL